MNEIKKVLIEGLGIAAIIAILCFTWPIVLFLFILLYFRARIENTSMLDIAKRLERASAEQLRSIEEHEQIQSQK